MKSPFLLAHASIVHSAKKKKIFHLVASDCFHLVIEFCGKKSILCNH